MGRAFIQHVWLLTKEQPIGKARFQCTGCRRILELGSQPARNHKSMKYFSLQYYVNKGVLVERDILPECGAEQIRCVMES